MRVREYVECKSDDKTDINEMLADLAASLDCKGSIISLDAQRMQTTHALLDVGIESGRIYIPEINRKVYRKMVDQNVGVHLSNCDIKELVTEHRKKISLMYLDYMGNTEIMNNFKACLAQFAKKRTAKSVIAVTFSCRLRTKDMTFELFLNNDVMPAFVEQMPGAHVQTKCVLGYMRTVGSPMAHCQFLIDWDTVVETEYWPKQKIMADIPKTQVPKESRVQGVAKYDLVQWYAFPHSPTWEPAGALLNNPQP